MNNRSKLFFLGTALIAASIMTAPSVAQETRNDEIPMYGGRDRGADPEIKAADEKFIADVSAAFGSRERASIAWINQGFKFYNQDQLGMAVRRFNQAWLLNPKNAEVYSGFAAVLHDQGKYCQAMDMMEKSLSLNPPTFQGIYPDAARITALCGARDSKMGDETRKKLFIRSEDLYRKAEQVEPNKAYVYASWATAYYWEGKFPEAWAMVKKARSLGYKVGAQFLTLLQEKLPKPD